MNLAAAQRPSAGNLCLDHVSHFVADLQAAGRVLEALGFLVTPESAQSTQEGPAGTANRCVMLEQGYLEFLAPTADTPNARRLRAAMERYSGVHLACFGTPAADEEYARLAAHGFEPLAVIRLERPVPIGGESATARFKVVRSPPEKMPEGRIQFVEQLTPEAIWQPQYVAHRNGVTALAAVLVVAEDPVQVAARWARFTALLPRPSGNFVRLASARGEVMIGTRQIWEKRLGAAPPAAPALAGYALGCGDPDALAACCERAGAQVRRTQAGHAAVLPAALGGAWLFGTREALDEWFNTE